MSVEERKLEKFSKLIKRIMVQCECGIPIVVEGKNDEFALKQLGIHGKIFAIKSYGESLFNFLDRLNKFKEIILLTDFDKEGNELASLIIDELSKRGIKVNNSIRKQLKGLVNSEIRSIEELKSFSERLKLKTINKRHYVQAIA